MLDSFLNEQGNRIRHARLFLDNPQSSCVLKNESLGNKLFEMSIGCRALQTIPHQMCNSSRAITKGGVESFQDQISEFSTFGEVRFHSPKERSQCGLFQWSSIYIRPILHKCTEPQHVVSIVVFAKLLSYDKVRMSRKRPGTPGAIRPRF